MSHSINCVIIDDEIKGIEVLTMRLNTIFPDLNIVGSYTDWKVGMETLKRSKIDLLFLDISMPGKNGLDILKLFHDVSFEVIFVTAYSEYAIDAIRHSAAGYVLKPIDDFELSFAVNKVLEKFNKDNLQQLNAWHNTNIQKIGIPNVKGIDYVNADEILYCESINKYTKIVMKTHSIVSSYNLGEFKKIMDNRTFFNVHRSYLVNLHFIKRYESNGVLIMEDNMQIPVSKSVRTELLNIFNKISRTAGLK